MALRGIPAHYIESVTRLEGLSLSGRLLDRCPGIRIYVQWPELASRRWQYRGSVFDGFHSEVAEPTAIRKVVVTVGTSSTFGFRRLIERALKIIPADVEVLWQTGCTDVNGLAIDARQAVPNDELKAAIESADAVIAHAGAGISLTILGLGKVPLLVPRSAVHREHVDDHQHEIASALANEGLAVVADADDLDWGTVTRSAERRAVQRATPLPFRLDRHA
jgi:UDP-N-acetylglucosamine transferase subunit ALG13